MIIWGHRNRDRHEGTGRFRCPQCDDDQDFTLIRTWKYFHLYFIPLAKQGVVAERIQCKHCDWVFPITVLAGNAHEVSSACGAGDGESISDNFGNVVSLTEPAIQEIKERHAKAQFDPDVVVRVEPDRSGSRKVTITFDFPLADGRDWIGESHGIPIVVSRDVAPELQGRYVNNPGS